jgi:hypothetical protein
VSHPLREARAMAEGAAQGHGEWRLGDRRKTQMPFALYVDVIPPEGGKIKVQHVFYGETEDECQDNFAAHAKGCEFLTPAIEDERIEEEVEEIDEDNWPSYEVDDEEEEAK